MQDQGQGRLREWTVHTDTCFVKDALQYHKGGTPTYRYNRKYTLQIHKTVTPLAVAPKVAYSLGLISTVERSLDSLPTPAQTHQAKKKTAELRIHEEYLRDHRQQHT